MEGSKQPRGAHLVGSVPLASSEEVFRTAASILGDHLLRIPDGETGVRSGWIGWQRAVFADHPAFEQGPQEQGVYGPGAHFRLRDRARARDLTFNALGYADAAIASYHAFEQLQRAGVIPPHMRFQVSLPTPMAPIITFVALNDRALVEPAYQRRMLAELDEIVAAIPTSRLAIQWDVAAEVALLEDLAPIHLRNPWGDIEERLLELGHAVPTDVEVGYHTALTEPSDASRPRDDTLSALVLQQNVGRAVDRPRRSLSFCASTPLSPRPRLVQHVEAQRYAATSRRTSRTSSRGVFSHMRLIALPKSNRARPASAWRASSRA